MDNEEKISTNKASPSEAEPLSASGDAVLIEPDLKFIETLSRQGGDQFKKCIQCGTCSGTCLISPDSKPFPAKEMAWANWGMKERLVSDVDIWLCYQCSDCSSRCPRNAQPGNLLAMLRQESIVNYSFPQFMGRLVNRPQGIPLLLGLAVALLSLALYAKEPLGNLLGFSPDLSRNIVYSYSSIFPHWLLNLFFFSFSALAMIIVSSGAYRMWQNLIRVNADGLKINPAKSFGSCLKTVFKKIIFHSDFSTCEKTRTRYLSHSLIFFGFIALTAVTFWVITARLNPLINTEFIYPFGFFNPWKMLANAGGLAVFAGCILVIFNRFKHATDVGSGTYFDWAFVWTIVIVVITGFATEVLHYLRLEPHRHIVYFAHLVFVFMLLIYMPYSKFAHMVYRAVALIYAEYTGRNDPAVFRAQSAELKNETRKTENV